jgi:hypothetical protein
MYNAAEALGADRYLLAAIGSWDLRSWNATEWETPPPHLRQDG